MVDERFTAAIGHDSMVFWESHLLFEMNGTKSSTRFWHEWTFWVVYDRDLFRGESLFFHLGDQQVSQKVAWKKLAMNSIVLTDFWSEKHMSWRWRKPMIFKQQKKINQPKPSFRWVVVYTNRYLGKKSEIIPRSWICCGDVGRSPTFFFTTKNGEFLPRLKRSWCQFLAWQRP